MMTWTTVSAMKVTEVAEPVANACLCMYACVYTLKINPTVYIEKLNSMWVWDREEKRKLKDHG